MKIWVQDEGRFGLLSFTRRVWTLRGIKPVVKVQQKYQWRYVFAALACTSGELEAAYWDSVGLAVTRDFLGQIVASDPQAEHVVIYDARGSISSHACMSCPRVCMWWSCRPTARNSILWKDYGTR